MFVSVAPASPPESVILRFVFSDTLNALLVAIVVPPQLVACAINLNWYLFKPVGVAPLSYVAPSGGGGVSVPPNVIEPPEVLSILVLLSSDQAYPPPLLTLTYNTA